MIERLTALRQSIGAGLVIGVGLFALAVGVRVLAGDALNAYPFLTFFPAIILTALLSGVRAATLVTALAAATAWYYFIPPARSWDVGPGAIVGIVFFLFVAALDIALIEFLHRVVRRLHSERARAATLIEARESMFKELQHRVANNMQFIAGLLAVQKRRAAGTLAEDVLEQAGSRLAAMSRIHRQLYDPANADRAFGPLVEGLCHELLEATGAKNIVCTVQAPDVRLPIDRVLALSMIVTEALTNAVKHAYPNGEAGTIRISLEHLPDEHMAFIIADDGRGMPAEFDVAKSTSLGMRIVQSLAQQLGGEFSYGPAASGSELRLRFKPA